MAYGDIKTQFSGLLNRRDASPTLQTTFLQQGLQRLQRTLRIPAMEKSIVATIGNLYTDGLQVPSDLLELIAITDVGCAAELVRRPLSEVIQFVKYGSGAPLYYTRRGSKFLIGPTPSEGTQLRMDYYATFAPLSADEDTNVLTAIAPDLLVYTSLVYAGQHFNDNRAAGWRNVRDEIMGDLQAQADADELSGNAQVALAYSWPED